MRGKCNYITFILILYSTYGHVSRTPTWSLLLQICCYNFVLVSHVLLSYWKLNLFPLSCVDHLGNISARIRTIKFLNIILSIFLLLSTCKLKCAHRTDNMCNNNCCRLSNAHGVALLRRKIHSWATNTRDHCIWGWQWNVSIIRLSSKIRECRWYKLCENEQFPKNRTNTVDGNRQNLDNTKCICWCNLINYKLSHCGRVTQICGFNTVKLGTSASSP